jgi:hypothetical protein
MITPLRTTALALFVLSIAQPLFSQLDAPHVVAAPGSISDEMLKTHLTAKDLIGADIHGTDGEVLASVHDVVLAEGLLAPAPGEQTIDLGRAAAIAAPETGTGFAAGALADATPRTETADRDGEFEIDRSVPVGEGDSPLVVLSVGGLFGVGRALVTMPLNAFRHEPDTHRILLPMSKADFEAATAMVDRAADTDAREIARDVGTRVEDVVPVTDEDRAAVVAKEALTRDLETKAERIRRELRSNAVLAPASWKIDVITDGEAIILSGTVASQMDKDRILALATEITSAAVIDHIVVKG